MEVKGSIVGLWDNEQVQKQDILDYLDAMIHITPRGSTRVPEGTRAASARVHGQPLGRSPDLILFQHRALDHELLCEDLALLSSDTHASGSARSPSSFQLKLDGLLAEPEIDPQVKCRT